MECRICFEKKEVRAILPCNHNIYCGECIFKEIALLGNRICPTCRSPIKSAIFTIIPKKTYSDLLQEYRFDYNSKFGIYFDSKAIEKWFLNLLEYECPICYPFVEFNNMVEKKYLNEYRESYFSVEALNSHLASEHHQKVCEICAKSNRMYPHELKQYGEAAYNAHVNGITVDPTLPKHVHCHACQTICYDNRFYLKHCREKHVHCFLCGVNNPANFFANENALHAHYNKSHYPCLLCNYQFVGETMLDLVNHKSKDHSSQPFTPPPSVTPQPSNTTPAIPSTSQSKNKKRKNKQASPSVPQPSQLSSSSLTPSNTIRFNQIRDAFSGYLDTILTQEQHTEEFELANIIVELSLSILDYLLTTPTYMRLELTSEMKKKLYACINRFSFTNFSLNCLIPCGLSPVHASKFNSYFARYYTPVNGWKYRYLVCSANFKLYTINELWVCCCYFYLLTGHLLALLCVCCIQSCMNKGRV